MQILLDTSNIKNTKAVKFNKVRIGQKFFICHNWGELSDETKEKIAMERMRFGPIYIKAGEYTDFKAERYIDFPKVIVNLNTGELLANENMETVFVVYE